MAVKVGSFTKSTNTSVPVSQQVVNVGFTPKALILWTAGNTSADTWQDAFLRAFGVTTGASESLSVAGAMQDNVSPTNSSSRVAEKALTIVQWGETLLAECNLTSFDADGFTLSWTTNDAVGYIIDYMAIGGDEITNAKLVKWTTPADTGNNSITGVGFTPDAVLHFLSNQAAALPSTGATCVVGVGAMDSDNEWAIAVGDPDGRTSADRSRLQATLSYCLSIVGTGIGASSYITASYVSMDADGFTLNHNTAAASGYHVGSLCLTGDVDVGNYQFTDTGNQSVTGVGFQPGGVLQLSTSKGDSNTPLGAHRLSIGAMDANSDIASFSETTQGSNPVASTSYRASSKAVLISTTEGDDTFSAVTDYVSLDADGFTVNHTGNSTGSPGYVIGYLAVKGAAAGGSALLMQHYHHSEFHGGAHNGA